MRQKLPNTVAALTKRVVEYRSLPVNGANAKWNGVETDAYRRVYLDLSLLMDYIPSVDWIKLTGTLGRERRRNRLLNFRHFGKIIKFRTFAYYLPKEYNQSGSG